MTAKLKIKDTLLQSFSLLKHNFFKYVVIIIILETFLVLAINEIIKQIFTLALLTAKVDGITNDNFMAILKNPLALSAIFIVILIALLLIVLQVTLTYYYTSNHDNLHISTLKNPLSALKKVKIRHLFILFIYIFLIMPNGNLGMTSGLTSKIHLPKFIVSAMMGNVYFVVIYYTLITISFYLNLRLFYTFAIFTNEPLSFTESMKKSWTMTKKNLLKIVWITVIINIISALLILISYLISYGLYELFIRMLPHHLYAVKNFFQGSFVITSAIILSLMTVFIIQITITTYQKLSNQPVKTLTTYSPNPRGSILRFSLIILSMAMLIFAITLTHPIPKFSDQTLVVSHRGESKNAIENTLDALRLANKDKPDYVEIDVQQTKDHKLIVFHDYNLRRLTRNIRKESINELTLAELSKVTLHQGSITSNIATLYDFLSLAKSLKQSILLEIKTTVKDNESFIDDIIFLIEDLNMHEMVIFQSLDLQMILKLKEKYPEKTAGYIISFNIGGLKNYPIDFYAMEVSSVSSKVLNDLRRYQKSLFIWTINLEEDIASYLQLDVAGIITDNTTYAMQAKRELASNDFSNILFNLELSFL